MHVIYNGHDINKNPLPRLIWLKPGKNVVKKYIYLCDTLRILVSQLTLTTNMFGDVNGSLNHTAFHQKNKSNSRLNFSMNFSFGINFNKCLQEKRKMEIISWKKEHFTTNRHATSALVLFQKKEKLLDFSLKTLKGHRRN